MCPSRRWWRCHLDRLFPECEVQAHGLFQIIRDSDVELEEEAERLGA